MMHCDPDRLPATGRLTKCTGPLCIDANDLRFDFRFIDTREIRRKQ